MSGAAALVLLLLCGAPAPAAPNAAASPAPARDAPPWASLLGSGLLTLQDAATLPAGKFTISLTVDNRDRDPLGLDLVDGAIAWNLGVTRWAEVYGHHVFSRSVAVPDTPVLPPPPLDTLLAPGTAPPRRPYYSIYSPVPYVDDSGPIRFGSDIPGEGVLGGKARLFGARRARPALALAVDVKFPLTRELRYLKAGAGTGGIDLRFGVASEWQAARTSLVVATAFTRVGRPFVPDRRIESRNGIVVATDEALVLPHRVDLGAGVRRRLTSTLAAVGELTTVFEVGHRTRIVDRARPIDVLGGLQLRWKNVRATAALRYHGNALASMAVRPSPLAGLVDMRHVSEEALAAYLGGIGLAGAHEFLRPGAHRLLVPPAGGPPLPEGARVIPDTYRIRSEHQVGFVLLWGIGF
jgi:hypothetical protein